jgi:hypothetical protein
MNNKEIFELFQQLGTYAATARELGCDPRTVRRKVSEHYNTSSVPVSESTRTGVPFDQVSHYWLKTQNEAGDNVSLFVKNKQGVIEYEELRDKLIEDLAEYAPIVPAINHPDIGSKHNLLIIDPADVHIGKLALRDETGHNPYNLVEAVTRVRSGVNILLRRAQSFDISEIVIVVGNDILHVDSERNTTTRGTHQDTDGMWWQMFEVARNMYVNIIDDASRYAPVSLVFCPSNHDKHLGFGITDSLYSWYRNNENVTITNYGKSMRHRKYIQFGANLIGFTHGDGAKNKDLPGLMQYEAREAWGNAKFSYWYVHHLHHKYRIVNGVETEKEDKGITVISNASLHSDVFTSAVECIRSPSEADSWHSQYGYVNTTAIEAFVHDPYLGQIARLTAHC